LLMYAMLLAPKFLGAAAVRLTGLRYRDLGGAGRFTVSFLTEVILSIAYAPILMVQQMIAVFRTAIGLQRGWAPQARDGGRYGLGTLVLCHGLETVSGAALLAGILSGLVTAWLLPIAISLALAVPLSWLSGVSLARFGQRLLGTAETFREPSIMQAARHYRAELKANLDGKAVKPRLNDPSWWS